MRISFDTFSVPTTDQSLYAEMLHFSAPEVWLTYRELRSLWLVEQVIAKIEHIETLKDSHEDEDNKAFIELLQRLYPEKLVNFWIERIIH